MRRLSMNEWIAVAVGVCLIGFLLMSGMISSLFSGPTSMQEDNNQMSQPGENMNTGTSPEESVVSVRGSLVTVHYTGKLTNGQVFDSSVNRGPFSFVVGNGDVIRGWDEGLIGVKKGDKKTLTLSPKDAYGAAQGHPLQTQTLIFDIAVLDVRNP